MPPRIAPKRGSPIKNIIRQLRSYLSKPAVQLPLAIATVGFPTYLAINDRLVLTKPVRLKTFVDKLFFTINYFVVIAALLVACQINVVVNRVLSRTPNPLTQRNVKVQKANNILNNSIEAAIITVITQLTLTTLISAEDIVRFIPLINYMFVYGRVVFAIGYPHLRLYGFAINLLINLLIISYALIMIHKRDFS